MKYKKDECRTRWKKEEEGRRRRKKKVLSLLWVLAFIFYKIFFLFENLFSIYLFGALLAASVGGISRGTERISGQFSQRWLGTFSRILNLPLAKFSLGHHGQPIPPRKWLDPRLLFLLLPYRALLLLLYVHIYSRQCCVLHAMQV